MIHSSSSSSSALAWKILVKPVASYHRFPLFLSYTHALREAVCIVPLSFFLSFSCSVQQPDIWAHCTTILKRRLFFEPTTCLQESGTTKLTLATSSRSFALLHPSSQTPMPSQIRTNTSMCRKAKPIEECKSVRQLWNGLGPSNILHLRARTVSWRSAQPDVLQRTQQWNLMRICYAACHTAFVQQSRDISTWNPGQMLVTKLLHLFSHSFIPHNKYYWLCNPVVVTPKS